ncbi:MAG TPA: PPC domain-containing protein [Pirellulales bacterium]|nr:PPC domain-containing protein [Pirellulales bacterium]
MGALALCVLAATFEVTLSTAARGELPSIRLNRIQPLGAAAGSTVEVEVAAADAEEAKQLLFDHPGLKAEQTAPNKFKVAIAADVPEGTYDVRLLGRFGLSNPRLFAVSHGLVDVPEKEPNNAPAEAQAIPLNAAVAAVSDSNNQDLFRFAARQGQRLTLECQAGRLDSELDASLAVLGPSGAVLASNSDYRGRDPLVDFLCPADGEYLIEVHDLSYRGGYPYRLIVSDRADVENVFPRAVEPGKPVELTALGRNFGTAGQKSKWTFDDRPLEEYRFTFTPPGAAEALGNFRFLEHPTDHSVLPTAATCTLSGFQVRVPLAAGSAPAITLLAAEGPVTLEQEANDVADAPQTISLPATVSGRFDRPRDADWFQFAVDEQGRYEIQVYSERIAGQADPFVVVVDDQKKRIAEYDDFGHRINAFDGHLRDPVGSIDLAKGRTYRLLVQDRYGRGGARYQYVLTVRRSQPDFFVAAIHGANPGPSGVNVWQGGAAHVDLVIHRQDGYGGPVTVTAAGLPPGLHAAEVKIPNDTRGVMTFWSDPDAPKWNGTVRLTAKGEHEGRPIVREVRPYTRVWTDANMSSSRPTRELAIAMIERAPYSLRIEPDRATHPTNGQLELKVLATRHWPEFKAPIRVIGLGLPGGFQFAESEIAENAAEKAFTLQLNNVRPGEYTLVLLGQAQVPFKKDAAGTAANTLVSTPSLPLTVVVEAEKK